MDAETKSKAMRFIATATTVIYRLLTLAALLWIGYSLQSIAITLNTPIEDGDVVDQSSDGPDQPQIMKPMLRGQM